MSKPAPVNFKRVGMTALYTLGAWVSLTLLLFATTWDPQETALQSGRVIVLILAGVSLLMCVIAATARLLASLGAALPDPDPKP